MAEQLRSPRSPTPLAAAVPARFAEERDTRWRELEGGELEVATLRDGVLERHRVHSDGTTTMLESLPPTLFYRWGRIAAFGGWGLAMLGIGWLALTRGHWAGIVMFFVGMASMAFGAFAGHPNLDRALKRLGGGPWVAPARLSGWVPASTEQLATVEQLADDHDGVAYVHDLGARSTEVLVLSKQSADRSTGSTTVVTTGSCPRRSEEEGDAWSRRSAPCGFHSSSQGSSQSRLWTARGE